MEEVRKGFQLFSWKGLQLFSVFLVESKKGSSFNANQTNIKKSRAQYMRKLSLVTNLCKNEFSGC